MIQLEPSKRISTKGIINHPYFTDYKKIKVESIKRNVEFNKPSEILLIGLVILLNHIFYSLKK
jgi:hypothetical protein